MATRKERHQSKTTKKSSFPLFGILGVVVVIIAVGAWYYAKPSADESATVGSISETAEIQGDWGMGNPDAKLTIIEYGDFQCPACGFYHPIVKELMEEFNDDVYFIFRHFPLVNAHQFATMAASAAEAAGRQGKFWEMHDLLMTNQQMWSRGMASSAFLAYARELGLDDVQFQQDVRDEAIFAKIEKDFNSGVDLKINSVPSFFFNGTYTPTPRTKEAFRQLIIDKLSELEAAE